MGPYRFYFYAGDRSEPAHIHVERDDSEAKYWLDPVQLERNRGFRRSELTRIEKLIVEHRQHLLDQWHEFFDN
jgi:hypothetical protein